MNLQDWILVIVFIAIISCFLVKGEWQDKAFTALGAELLFGVFYFISYSVAMFI